MLWVQARDCIAVGLGAERPGIGKFSRNSCCRLENRGIPVADFRMGFDFPFRRQNTAGGRVRRILRYACGEYCDGICFVGVVEVVAGWPLVLVGSLRVHQ